MKIQYINTIALFGVLFILCPLVVYAVDPAIFEKRFEVILQSISSVAGGLLLLNILGLNQTLLRTDTVRVYTLPVIALVLFVEGLLLFVANSAFFDAHWSEISPYGGSLLGGAVLAVFLGLNYHLIERVETTEEVKEA
jgi:hypothetical protein